MSSITIVMALNDDGRHLEASLEGFLRELGANGEIVLVDASHDGCGLLVRERDPRIRVIRAKPRSLVPELWTIGLTASSSDSTLIAFTTSAMEPSTNWLFSMREGLKTRQGAVGVGGSIEIAPRCSATDRAIYCLRFARYSQQRLRTKQPDPSGENAIYRRSALESVAEAWRDGFWEVEVQKRLKAQGAVFAIAEAAEVRYLGGGRLGRMLLQRWRHAWRFAQDRSRFWNWRRRWRRAALFPVVPAVLLIRSLREAGSPLLWLSSVPSLLAMSTAWALGEAAGMVAPRRMLG